MDSNHIEYHHDKAKYRPHTTREWTIQEYFAILPVVLACPSQIAYDAACRLLVGAFDRNPQHPPGTVLTAQDRARECRQLIEGRIDVLLAGGRFEEKFADWISIAERQNTLLTWGEREVVLKSYVRRVSFSRKTISIDDVAVLVDRGGLYENFQEYVANCDLSRTEPDEEGPSPAGPKNIQKVYGAVTDFVRGDIEDEYAVTTAWETLHRVCRELE